MKYPAFPKACLFCLALFPGPYGWSQGTVYFERDAFLNACQTLQGERRAITFDGYPDLIGPTLSIEDVTFTGRYLVVSQINSSANPSQMIRAIFNFDSGVPLGISFGSAASAFGADFSSDLSSIQVTAFLATLSLDTGDSFTFTAPVYPESKFFGFISPVPIRNMTFSDGGMLPYATHEELVGDLYMVLEVPEPGAAALLTLAGFALLFRPRS